MELLKVVKDSWVPFGHLFFPLSLEVIMAIIQMREGNHVNIFIEARWRGWGKWAVQKGFSCWKGSRPGFRSSAANSVQCKLLIVVYMALVLRNWGNWCKWMVMEKSWCQKGYSEKISPGFVLSSSLPLFLSRGTGRDFVFKASSKVGSVTSKVWVLFF